MKKDLVVKNFECGNDVKDITLSISPITFLVGPDERKKLEIMRSSDEKLGFKMINKLPPCVGLFIEEDEKNFIDFWTEKFDINEDGTKVEESLWSIITKIACNYYRGCIILNQPGCDLYPAKQSLLADMFYDAYKKFGVWFIINTNSEYLIRKSQVLVKKMEFASIKEAEENSPFTTYCVPMDGKPYSLGYRHDGIFKEEFVTGFYDEASNQAFEIL
jgi:hypothetical protein